MEVVSFMRVPVVRDTRQADDRSIRNMLATHDKIKLLVEA
jgi:hypothetical protein